MIDRGLLTVEQADRLIQEFRRNLQGKFLGICLPDGLTNAQLRRRRPAVWLSTLCVASSGSSDFLDLAPMLFGELKTFLDERIISGAEPDLDALQAFMNYVSFHYDPALAREEQLMQAFHTAIDMAVQMTRASRIHSLPEDADIADDDMTDEVIQLSRDLLFCYWASFSLTIKIRRPSMLLRTGLVGMSVRVLQTTGNQHDMLLIEWAKLARIGAETVLSLHRGHTQNVDGLSDEARDEIINSFEKKRRQWLVECPFNLVNGEKFPFH